MIADNCSDDTASIARQQGASARVLSLRTKSRRRIMGLIWRIQTWNRVDLGRSLIGHSPGQRTRSRARSSAPGLSWSPKAPPSRRGGRATGGVAGLSGLSHVISKPRLLDVVLGGYELTTSPGGGSGCEAVR